MKKIGIFGYGGHAAVVAEAYQALDLIAITFFTEKSLVASSPEPKGKVIFISRNEKIPQLGKDDKVFGLGIGNNEARLFWCEKLLQEGFELPAIIHPRAWVSPSAILGAGVFIGAGAVIQAGAKIEKAAIINSNATVEHHCIVEMGSHIGPGAILAGLVHVGEIAMVGAGAVIKDRIQIGKGAIIGAGAAVVQNVPEGITVGGVPAKPIR